MPCLSKSSARSTFTRSNSGGQRSVASVDFVFGKGVSSNSYRAPQLRVLDF